MLDYEEIETVIVVTDPEGYIDEYKYTAELFGKMIAKYGRDNVRLQDRYSWK